MNTKKSYIGVVLFALLVIARYMYHLWYLNIHYGFTEYQRAFFSFLSYPEIVVRYLFSNALRIIGIFLSVGLLLAKEHCRRLMVYLCWFNILTVYWKHPFKGVYKSAPSIADRFPFPGNWIVSLNLSHEQLTWAWIIFFSIIEFLVSGAVLYYLTRPDVKVIFTKDR